MKLLKYGTEIPIGGEFLPEIVKSVEFIIGIICVYQENADIIEKYDVTMFQYKIHQKACM